MLKHWLKPTKFTAFQTGIFKLTMTAFGIALATSWPETFAQYSTFAWLIWIVGAVYLLMVKMSQK